MWEIARAEFLPRPANPRGCTATGIPVAVNSTKNHSNDESKTMDRLVVASTEIKRVDGLYCLNDLHKASGGEKKKTPSEWLRNQHTKGLIQALKSGALNSAPIKVVNGGRVGSGTYVCKELVYAYAMWISPEFNIYVIRTFDAMAASEKPESSEAIVTAMLNAITEVDNKIRVHERAIADLQVVGAMLGAEAQKLRGLH